MTEENYYYQVFLEVSKKEEETIFGFINVSHIPYEKFEGMFKEQIGEEDFLFRDTGYSIDEEIYARHREFLEKEVHFRFDFALFDYAVSLYGDEKANYRKDYYDHLPE